MTLSGDIVQEYINRFPKTPNLTLARKIHKENSMVFRNIEVARTAVRYSRGALGKDNRKSKNINSILTPKFSIPEGDNINYEPYIISDELKTGALLYDIHFPYHDKKVLDAALTYIYNSHPDFMLLVGDIADFHQISFFERDPRKKKIVQELKMLEYFFAELRLNFPGVEIIYKLGNHEERYDRFIMQKAPELFDIEQIQLKNILNLEKHNIALVDNKRIIRYCHLNIIHGHEYKFNISNPVNPARGIFLRTHKITTAGHFHQASEHNETSINGDKITCWSAGCLCDLHPQWMPLNKWGHGFQTIKCNDKGMWQLTNHKIINGEVI